MSASDLIAKQSAGSTTEVVEGAQGLKVPLPLLFLLLMLLVILAVHDIMKKSYAVHREANYRVAKAALETLGAQSAFSRLFSLHAGERRSADPLMVMLNETPFILSDPKPLVGARTGSGAVHVAVALPARDLLFDELEKFEVFGSGQLKSFLGSESDLSRLTDLIVSLQKRDYAQFHFSAVAQIVIVLAAFVISVMIGHHVDRKNDALRQSRDAISHREQEARHLRVEAERASEAKSQFIQNMSHELRTPLNAVIGFSEIIVDQKLGPVTSEYCDCASEIKTAGNNLLTLVNDILDMSRIEAAWENVNNEEIDITALMKSMSRQMEELATEAGVSLEIELPDRLPHLYSDDGKIRQILLHLMSNAIKFTPEDGQVRLCVEPNAGGGIVFKVADNGIGMSPKDQERALALFGQLDTELSRRHEGSGLGLPLAKSSVELLGGGFDLQSEVGVGTEVTFYLPDNSETAQSVA